MSWRRKLAAAYAAGSMMLAGCGGGGLDESGCTGNCADAGSALSTADVETVVAQAVAEAQARSAPATIAVVDRVGNVLGVYAMNGAPDTVTITSGRDVAGGLEAIDVVPSAAAAIAKAVTGAFLSSEGNAFSTRTASQIVQEHFNPGEFGQPSGPLFGVQFSQLPCSDLNRRFGEGDAGPKRSPLGLSADPGGFPLYLNGTPVGGVGVSADGVYGLDAVVTDVDADTDELIALAATQGYAPPANRRGDRITVEGKTFRFSDANDDDLQTDAGAAVPAGSGSFVAVTAYTDGTVRAGTAFGQSASGIRPAGPPFDAQDGFVLVDDTGAQRFAPRAGTDAAALAPVDALTTNEVTILLSEALDVANRARAQIRRPLDSRARVSIVVVDTFGAILGIVRGRDAPVFGIDVALQKARTAAFFSNPEAAADLRATPDTTYLGNNQTVSIADRVDQVRGFFDDPAALTGGIAFADRSGGNLSRPYFPDGIVGNPPGPLSVAFEDWSPFAVGLQLDLVNTGVLTHVVHVLGGGPDIEAGRCTELPDTPTGRPRLPNGIQIFPGSVPIYRDRTLVGGIGVSGDGIDQDDMIAFLGTHNAGQRLGTLGNAPVDMRADTLTPQGTRLRYVQCPFAPFLDSDEQQPCAGK